MGILRPAGDRRSVHRLASPAWGVVLKLSSGTSWAPIIFQAIIECSDRSNIEPCLEGCPQGQSLWVSHLLSLAQQRYHCPNPAAVDWELKTGTYSRTSGVFIQRAAVTDTLSLSTRRGHGPVRRMYSQSVERLGGLMFHACQRVKERTQEPFEGTRNGALFVLVSVRG